MSRRPYDDKLLSVRRFLATLGNHWTARMIVPAGQIVLFDEGLAQRAITVLIHGRGELDVSAARCYARAIPAPDILVYVVANPEIAMDRAQRRAVLPRRFRHLNRLELQSAFRDAARALDTTVSHMRCPSGRPMQVMVIDSNDLDKAKMEFDAKINRLLAA
jgi:thymidylate kinase